MDGRGFLRGDGTAVAIKTITSMVLISIHPFAARKIILLLVALLGFSALCFADPVLMVRRHGPVHSRVAVALPVQTVALQLTYVTAPTFAANTTTALAKANASDLPEIGCAFKVNPTNVQWTQWETQSAPVGPTIRD
jgi:hypothetical protein